MNATKRRLPSKAQSWLPLAPGDIIDLVAPGFPCKPGEFEPAIDFIRSWGYEPRVPKGLFAKDLMCSAPDDVRLRTLLAALRAEDSKAVWCLRGGYGSMRLLPELARVRAPKTCKLFVGLSDITTLHTFLNQNWGWSTIHGPMADRLGRGDTAPKFLREIESIVRGQVRDVVFRSLKPLNAAARAGGIVKAPVTGGNLITLQATLGTDFLFRPRGKIVFLEDIGERAYRVDRVFEHFRQAGLWKGVKAVVFGDFTGGKDPDGVDRVPALLSRFAESVSFPVFKGIQSGHGPVQRPIPFGPRAELRLGSSGTLTVDTGVIRRRDDGR